MDINGNGVLEEWEYWTVLIELNEFASLCAADTDFFTVEAYQTAYPDLTEEWVTLFDEADADGVIDGKIYIAEWNKSMKLWH